MLKKILIAIGLLFGLLAACLVITRVTGYAAVYNTPTPSNEPGIKVGDKILITKFVEPRLYKYITFKSPCKDSLLAATGIEQSGANYVNRLCGMPGDQVEMKNSVLFVNNRNFDAGVNLKQQYYISKEDAAKTNPEDFSENELVPFGYGGDSNLVLITLDRDLLKKYKPLIKLTPFYIKDTSSTTGGFKWLDKHSTWTVDNFGPLTIPKDSCFVLGDNRHNALDSRYSGFVAIKDITGVVVGKL